MGKAAGAWRSEPGLSNFNLFKFNPQCFISVFERYKKLAKNQVEMWSEHSISADTPIGAGFYVTFHMRPV